MKEALSDALLWQHYAEGDLQQARRILQQPQFLPRHPAWLAQQAAEKALKAALIAAAVAFPRTHDLALLHRLVPEEWTVKGVAADLERLSEYAVDARYPGDWPEITEEDARDAVADAHHLVQAVRTDLDARAAA